MGMQDAAAAQKFYTDPGRRAGIIGAPATDFLWAGGRLVDAWPRSPDHDVYGQMQTSTVETLLVRGTLDVATPPQVSTTELLRFLPNGHQVLLADLGHSDDFRCAAGRGGDGG